MTPENEAHRHTIQPGTIIEGSYWPEPVEVKLIEDAGDYVHIVGATVRTRQHVDQIIPREEFENLEIAKSEATFSEEPWKVFLALETIRYHLATETEIVGE